MPLIVHHLNVSQSERIPWLCEELSIPYTLKTYRRDPVLAPPEYKALHPSETSPIIQDGEGDALITIAESGACMEYIAHRYGKGALFLPPTHPDYAQFLYWWHWANGTFQPAMLLNAMVGRMGVPDDNPRIVMGRERMNMMLRALNERVKKNKWLAGEDFTVADIMLVFSLTTMRYFFQYSLKEYEGVVGYLERIGKREAYQRAMAKSDPGMEPALGADPPSKPFGAQLPSK
ncbi:glutathione S-transferase [Favolaschia claudopus]|uniref:Glutathione S-transferase n=1 Tax=Favolaschia claudopus TaxID=2862362 RepID=A0AAW0BBW0_9AGAR